MPSESKPWVSVSCGCRPSEARQLTKELRERYGTVCAHFDLKTGDGVATSQEGMNAIIKFREGAHSDPSYKTYCGE